MKKFLHLFVLIICLLSILFTATWMQHIHRSIIQSPGVTIVIPSQATIRDMANLLGEQGVNFDRNEFYTLLRTTGWANKIKAGEYYLPPGSSLLNIIQIMVSGNVVKHRITIVDGWNIYQVMQALANNPFLQHTLAGKSPAEVAKALGITQPSPEGWIYPDTYVFTLNTPDITILKKAYVNMQQQLATAWAQRDMTASYTDPYQALIVASMLEKETAQPNEMPIIAGIILKRLQASMRLQIDATVIYGLWPNYSGKLTSADLKKKTPYNTYRINGLPPTPIAMPDKLAIQAALHPVQTNAWYYVAKGDGTHVFSATLIEQDAAIKQIYKLPGK